MLKGLSFSLGSEALRSETAKIPEKSQSEKAERPFLPSYFRAYALYPRKRTNSSPSFSPLPVTYRLSSFFFSSSFRSWFLPPRPLYPRPVLLSMKRPHVSSLLAPTSVIKRENETGGATRREREHEGKREKKRKEGESERGRGPQTRPRDPRPGRRSPRIPWQRFDIPEVI